MEWDNITIEYDDTEFEFQVERSTACGRIHIYVKEIWWAAPADADFETYIQLLRHYARRLEALASDGWTLVNSDGEHLYFENESYAIADPNPHRITDELE